MIRIKSFKQFIEEGKIRSVEQAIKLGTYLAGRHEKRFGRAGALFGKAGDDSIRHVEYVKNPAKRAKVKEVCNKTHNWQHKYGNFTMHGQPITLNTHDIIPTQPDTAFNSWKARTKFKDNDPVKVVKYQNKYYVWDGHHRLLAHKLQGIKQVNCTVLDIDSVPQ